MHFDRTRPSEHSPVERAALYALGVDRFDFQRTGEREIVVPERVLEQQRREAAEAQRLREAGIPDH
jgi:hypothetical protein